MAVTTALAIATATIGRVPDSNFLVLIAILIFLVGGFNSFNAVADLKIDLINKPKRPVPSKKITYSQALFFSALLYTLALFLSFLINREVFFLTVFSIFLTIAYSFPRIYLKKFFLFGNLSVVFFYTIFCGLLGWALYPSYPIPLTVILFLFFLGVGLSVLKDYEDILGDWKYHIKSIPIALGYKCGILFVVFSLFFSLIFLFYSIIQGLLSIKYLLIVAVFPFFVLNTLKLWLKRKKILERKVFHKTIILIIFTELLIVFINIL